METQNETFQSRHHLAIENTLTQGQMKQMSSEYALTLQNERLRAENEGLKTRGQIENLQHGHALSLQNMRLQVQNEGLQSSFASALNFERLRGEGLSALTGLRIQNDYLRQHQTDNDNWLQKLLLAEIAKTRAETESQALQQFSPLLIEGRAAELNLQHHRETAVELAEGQIAKRLLEAYPEYSSKQKKAFMIGYQQPMSIPGYENLLLTNQQPQSQQQVHQTLALPDVPGVEAGQQQQLIVMPGLQNTNPRDEAGSDISSNVDASEPDVEMQESLQPPHQVAPDAEIGDAELSFVPDDVIIRMGLRDWRLYQQGSILLYKDKQEGLIEKATGNIETVEAHITEMDNTGSILWTAYCNKNKLDRAQGVYPSTVSLQKAVCKAILNELSKLKAQRKQDLEAFANKVSNAGDFASAWTMLHETVNYLAISSRKIEDDTAVFMKGYSHMMKDLIQDRNTIPLPILKLTNTPWLPSSLDTLIHVDLFRCGISSAFFSTKYNELQLQMNSGVVEAQLLPLEMLLPNPEDRAYL